MRHLAILTVLVLALVGCDQRGEYTAWRGHPTIVLCQNESQMLEHMPGAQWGTPEGFRTTHGLYLEAEDTVYLLCSDPEHKLSIPQAFYLVHELQHRADAKNGSNMWKLLQDESSPNGYAMGGWDFDWHHH